MFRPNLRTRKPNLNAFNKFMLNHIEIPPLDEAALLRLQVLAKDHPEIKDLLEQTESLRAELLAKAADVEIKPPTNGKAE